MFPRVVFTSFAIAILLACSVAESQEKDKKRRTGTVIGEIKSSKASPNGKNQLIEVLAPGEEKARSYRVQYDPKAKGPIPAVLEKVKAAKVGDRVQLEWIEGEGLNITAFQVLKKTPDKK